MNRILPWLLPGLVALAMLLVVGWPTLAVVEQAVGTGARSGQDDEGMRDALQTPRPGEIARPLGLAWTSLRLIGLTELIALPLGMILAFALARTDIWGRRQMLAVVIWAAFVPTPLLATGWLGGFGNAGRLQALGSSPVLAGLPGAAFIHAMAALPWVIVIAAIGFRAVEPDLESQARLDHRPGGVIRRVMLRRSLGSIAASALAVAVLTGGDMTITDLLQVRTYAEEAYTQFQLGNPSRAAAVAGPPLILLGGILVGAMAFWFRIDPARVVSAASRSRDWSLGRWRVPAALVVMGTAGNLVALPIYSLIWRAGRVGGRAAEGLTPRWSLGGLAGTIGRAGAELLGGRLTRPFDSPLFSSMILAGGSTLVAVTLAWWLAWFARGSAGWRAILAGVVALTLAVPGPVAGMAFELAYLPVSFVADTPLIIMLVEVSRILPFCLLILWPTVRSIPEAYLETADVAGYGPMGRVFRVAFPLTRPACFAAGGVAFALALGELPASNLVAPAGVELLSVRVWQLLHTGVESHLAGVGLVLLIVLGSAGMVAGVLLNRSYRGTTSYLEST